MKSAIRTRVATASLVSLAMVLVAGSSVAHGAVSGAREDVRGDVVEPSTPSGIAGGYLRDARVFEVHYEPAIGALEAQVRFWDTTPVDSGYPWFTLEARVGVFRGGRCDTGSAGGVVTRFRTPDDRPEPGGEVEAAITGDRGTVSGTYRPVTGGWSYRLQDARLRGRGYDCVAAFRLDHVSGAVDEIAGFCLGVNGTVACPRSRPTAPTGLRVVDGGDGQVTLDWNDAALDDGDAYQVYVDDRAVDLSVSGSRFTVMGLQNGTPYRFRVSVGRPGSYGDWTEAVLATPRAEVRVTGAGDGPPADPGSGAPDISHDAPSSGADDGSGVARGDIPVVPAFRLLATPRLRAFTRDGLRVAMTCAAGCRAVVRLEVSARVARALRTGRTLARSSSRRLRGEAELAVAVRPSGRISRRLRGLARLDATIVMEATDASGNSRRVSKRVTLRR